MMEILLDTLKWSGFVGAAALVLTMLKPLLDRRYSAGWRYGVWLGLAVLLLLAPVQWALPQAPAEPPVILEVPRVSVRAGSGVRLQPSGAGNASAGSGAPASPEPAGLSLEEGLTILWLSGAGLFWLYHLAGTWRFLRRARRWSRPAGERGLLYEAVCREMGLKKAPPLRVSAAVDSPMAAGLFRPCLLLPEEPYAPRQLDFILRHELTHYRRRDLWYKLVLLLANGLHWFNPLVWLLRREAERDLELTCDSAVMAGADAGTRRAYSEALLASIRPRRQRAVLSTHFYGGKEAMKERFRNILGRRGRRRGGAVLLAALLMTVAGACAFGVRAGGALSREELAQWQDRINSPELAPYIRQMYTDTAFLPPEELRDGSDEVHAAVTGGVRESGVVSLELEGNFPNGLTRGTLRLEGDRPVSFASPLYAAVETEARKLMETRAQVHISEAAENSAVTEPLTFPEKYITGLTCRESMTFDNVTYSVWTLQYRLRPNSMDNVQLSGGMSTDRGWVTEQSGLGEPLLIFSVDESGAASLAEQTWTTSEGMRTEGGWTWEEYLYCKLHMGLEGLDRGVQGGWPALDEGLLESLGSGHDTWATEWEDTAHTYLHRAYGIEDYKSVETLRTFQADAEESGHDQAVLAEIDLGSGRGGVMVLLARVVSLPRELQFWQVCGLRWEVGPPAQDFLPQPDESEPPGTGAAAPEPPASAPAEAPRPEPEGDSGEPAAAARESNLGPTGVIGDFDGDGQPDPDFLAGYTRRDDLGYPVYLPKDPAETPFLIDPATGGTIYIHGSLPTGITAEAIPDPDIRTSTGTTGDFGQDAGSSAGSTAAPEPAPNVGSSSGIIGDFDGDGVPDEEVWINGAYHRVIADPATGDVRFDPPAPEVWTTVSTTAPDAGSAP